MRAGKSRNGIAQLSWGEAVMNEAALWCWRAHGCLLTAGLGLNTGETSPTYTATALHTWEGWGWGMEPPTSLGTDHAASTVWGARGQMV